MKLISCATKTLASVVSMSCVILKSSLKWCGQVFVQAIAARELLQHDTQLALFALFEEDLAMQQQINVIVT